MELFGHSQLTISMGQAASQRRFLFVRDDPFICMSAVAALDVEDSAGALRLPVCHGEICVPITDLQVSRPQQPCGVRYE